MKIRANRKELADALTWTAQALSKRPPSPALHGIRMSTEGDMLTLAATDYDVSHICRVQVESSQDGVWLANGPFLREVIAALKGTEVELTADERRLTVTAGRSTYNVALIPATEYPSIPAPPAPAGMIHADDLARIIGTVEHAAGRDDAVVTLTAVHITANPSDGFTASTTDRYRIARARGPWAPVADGGTLDALPQVRPMIAAVKGMHGEVHIGAEGGMIGLSDDHHTVTVRCVENDYPKLDKLLTAPVTDAAEVDADEMAGAIKRASMAADTYGQVALTFGDEEIEITAGTDTSDGAEYVQCTGTHYRMMSFTAGYLLSALAAAASPRVSIQFTGETVKPVYIQPVGGESVNLLVMPRRQQ